MGLMFTGISINFFAIFLIRFALSSELRYEVLAGPFTIICIISWIISLIGAIFMVAKKYKSGLILVGIGSFIFMPIGFIAVIGARKEKDKNQPEPNLDKRRQLFKEHNNV